VLKGELPSVWGVITTLRGGRKGRRGEAEDKGREQSADSQATPRGKL